MQSQLLKTPFDKLRANGEFNQCFSEPNIHNPPPPVRIANL
jgi:hypothetical protein